MLARSNLCDSVYYCFHLETFPAAVKKLSAFTTTFLQLYSHPVHSFRVIFHLLTVCFSSGLCMLSSLASSSPANRKRSLSVDRCYSHGAQLDLCFCWKQLNTAAGNDINRATTGYSARKPKT